MKTSSSKTLLVAVLGWSAAWLAMPAGTLSAAIERLEVTYDYVGGLAAERAAAPYKEPDRELPKRLAELNYDEIRDIRFRPDQALWRNEALPFQLHLFHRTAAVREEVQIREFSSTHVQTIPFIRDFFDYGKLGNMGSLRSSLGYSGFRLHYPMNRPDTFDEVAVFHGASYFRALGAGQIYGLSSRGLAVDSGVPGVTEEFPVFTDFWIGKPRPGATEITVYALLDSKRIAGAYEFVIKPGHPTVINVRARLYARDNIALPGMAPLTSMFWFGKNSDRPGGDVRPQVHDSDGLLLHTADGAHIWRPLQNPRYILNTDLRAVKPIRFGLIQRERAISAYEDFEARYHERPSCWIEPVGDWGGGQVRLVELPTVNEYGDNVVAYWVPDKKPEVGKPFDLAYRMTWSLAQPGDDNLARVQSTRIGHLPDHGWGQLFWIDFAGAGLGQRNPANLAPQIDLGSGAKLRHQTMIPHPGIDGWRVALQIEGENPPQPGEKPKPVELRVRLRDGYEPVSETWVYTWLP
ncbi:MAG: glucan biosynthesis protein G [Verrucomicrobia bacterium]|nr:glucan biosynthesis protein G [Verrucomicrobiota bacterium]